MAKAQQTLDRTCWYSRPVALHDWKKTLHRMATLVLVLLLVMAIGIGWGQETMSEFTKAKILEGRGEREAAFVAYLAIPGAEYKAAELGRREPAKFLVLLAKQKDTLPPATWNLLKAELLLALHQKEPALAAYRLAAQNLAPGQYPVCLVQSQSVHDVAMPFRYGPGSQRDNWLIQRFVALGAWDDVEREFGRIWAWHREHQPYNGLGLQFALDFAQLLHQRQKSKAAWEVLLEPLCRLDLDRNPDLARSDNALPANVYLQSHVPAFRHVRGISRKEFVRIGYGLFKIHDAEKILEHALQQAIGSGTNAARRTLALVRLQQGKSEEALGLELEYLAQARLDPCNTAYRRGLIFEAYSKPAAAALEYEKSLELPYGSHVVPDQDEVTDDAAMPTQALQIEVLKPVAGPAVFYDEIFQRLASLYTALGQTDKALAMTLRQFEKNPEALLRQEAIELAARRYKAAGKELEFAAWARRLAEQMASPVVRANLYWVVGDYAGAVPYAVAAYRQGQYGAPGKEQFRTKGPAIFKLFLQKLVEQNPHDGISRLELLDLQDRIGDRDLIAALEPLLHEEIGELFPRGKGSYNRTHFRNYYDLAYRLLRLYEKSGQIEKLQRLGLRIANRDKPFQDWPAKWYGQDFDYRDRNDFPEDLNACLSLLVQYADTIQLQEQLGQAFQEFPTLPARQQLARRQKTAAASQKIAALRPANLPANVTVLVSAENVLAVAHDAKYLYSGHPWGICVYTLAGKPVTRVVLATAVLTLAAANGHLWAGAPDGLYHITPDTWQVGYLAGDADVAETERRRADYDRYLHNGVFSLAVDGHYLWIGLRRNIQRYDTQTGRLQIFTKNDLGLDAYGDWNRFFVDGDYVWADGYHGGRRFDKKQQTWQVVSYQEKPVHLIAMIAGELWGRVHLGEPLRERPCLIHRQTLAVEPILIVGNLTSQEQTINGPFSYCGPEGGKLIFSDDSRLYTFEREINKLRPTELSATAWFSSSGLRFSRQWFASGVTLSSNIRPLEPRTTAQFPWGGGECKTLALPDGKILVGVGCARSPRYQYPNEDWPEHYESQEPDGGLYLIDPAIKNVTKLSGSSGDSLAADQVLAVVLDNAGQVWLCTNLGLVVLDADDKIIARYTRHDGLLANRITSGALLGDKIYFASGWGDCSGGLIVYDQRLGIFTALMAADGLPTDKLGMVKLEGKKLRLEFLPEYQRQGHGNYLLHPPAYLDLTTGNIESGGEPKFLEQNQAVMNPGWADRQNREAMPYLGGYVISTLQHGNKTYLCGTRGLVIIPSVHRPALKIVPLPTQVIKTSEESQIEEARSVKITIATPTDLQYYLANPNGFIRAAAVAKLLGPKFKNNPEYLELLAPLAQDPNGRVRTSAVFLLSTATAGSRLVPALQGFLNDADDYVRAVAACALARNNAMPDLKYFEEILVVPGAGYGHAPADRYGNLLFGADSTIGVVVDALKVYEALAPHADTKIFGLLLRSPLYAEDHDNYEPRQKLLQMLGQSLRERPEAASVLLQAYDHPQHRTYSQISFARKVFQYAGPELLTVLHEALRSEDRIIRSNAARACGAIADVSSLQPLLKALDLESGLSRASIVWALGKLGHSEALPHLAQLYLMAKLDERRQEATGFRAAQSIAATESQYEQAARLEPLFADWDELQAARSLKPIQPRVDEELLSSRGILEAIAQLPIETTQPFYYRLAAATDYEAKATAAIHLGRVSRQDKQIGKIWQILQGLLAESSVQMTAAVSLLILGDAKAEKYILEWLTGERWQSQEILHALLRVQDPKRLAFARKVIEKCVSDSNLDDYLRRSWKAKGF